jgi:hypothetical protein
MRRSFMSIQADRGDFAAAGQVLSYRVLAPDRASHTS